MYEKEGTVGKAEVNEITKKHTQKKTKKKEEKYGTTEDIKGINKKQKGQKGEVICRTVKLPKRTTLKKGQWKIQPKSRTERE